MAMPRRTDEYHQTVNTYISGGVGGNGGEGGIQGGSGGTGEGLTMPLRAGQSHQTMNTYISGGVGGIGGPGGLQGGSGGAGEGPTTNYEFAAVGSLTMNHHEIRDSKLYRVAGDVSLMIQNHWPDDSHLRHPPCSTLDLAAGGRELSGPMRSLRHDMQTRSAPYDISSRPRPSGTGLTFDAEDPTSGPQVSFGRRSIVAPDSLPHIASQFKATAAPSQPSFSTPFPNTLQYHQCTDQADISDFSTWPGRNTHPTFAPPQSLHGGTFITGETVNLRHGEAGLHILHRAVALEALYNSAESFPQPKCHPETRTELLDDLYHWATAPYSEYAIRWLHGPAGAGKSAVMQSLCQRLQDAGRIGGSFFFKRDHPTRGDAKVLFATLAYQLALHQPELNSPISRIAETDPSVLGRGMDVQLRRLILEPCRMLCNPTPSILLIDGLDECKGHNIQREILHLIASVSKHDFRLRILVASRPELHILEMFEGETLRGLADAIDIKRSFEDVRTYLRAEFSRIHREHPTTMRNIPTPWPLPEILEMLVQNSSGYFIYASTVIRFIDDEYSRPSTQLDIIRNIVPCNSESPFEALDQLYIQILQGVPARHRPRLCDILSVILNFPTPINMEGIEELLGLEPDDLSLILRPLHSVLALPWKQDLEIRVDHASFHDFLNDRERSSDFSVGSPTHRAKLACSILRALGYTPENQQRKHVEWWFHWSPDEHTGWIEFITSLTPAADFVPLVRMINPDFVFYSELPEDTIESFLNWLKRIEPVPEDLIRCWEDYRYMHSYQTAHYDWAHTLLEECGRQYPERTEAEVLDPSLYVICTLHGRMNSKSQAVLEACRELLLRSPRSIRFFQAMSLLLSKEDFDYNIHLKILFYTRLLLDLSWNDIVEWICSLRPLATQEPLFFSTVFLFLPTLRRELGGLSIVSGDLARGSIRLMQRIGRGHLPDHFWTKLLSGVASFGMRGREGWAKDRLQWGRYIRSSPQSDPALLHDLRQFSPAWDVFSEQRVGLEPIEFYDVVQWLKASPDPQPDLIDRWEGYLTESMVRKEVDCSDDELEGRWQYYLKREANFYGPPQAFDEEVIQCWERCLLGADGSEYTGSEDGCGYTSSEDGSG